MFLEEQLPFREFICFKKHFFLHAFCPQIWEYEYTLKQGLCKYIALINFPGVKYENIYKIENPALNKIFSVI